MNRREWMMQVPGAGLLLASRFGFVASAGEKESNPMFEQPTPDDWAQASNRVRTAKLAVTAQNTFGLKLLRAMAAKQPRDPVFISPLSIFLALALAESGAAGSTRTALRQALALPDQESSVLDQSITAMQRALKLTGAQLAIANALWVNSQAPIDPAYIKRAEAVFRAHTAVLSADEIQAAKQVNDWVSVSTRGKIQKIVTPEQVREAVAVLTNAIYFAARWDHRFSKPNTRDGWFRQGDGTSKQVPMMRNPGLKLAYRSGPGYDGAALFYEESSVCFYALLPKPGTQTSDVLDLLDLERLLSGAGEYDLDLTFPRFELDFGASLSSYLKQLGMELAFQFPGANFRPMGSELFYISDVIHKSRLEVNEDGTVAAAATAVLMRPGSAIPKPTEKKILVFDRPFVVLIADIRTGAILFAGCIERFSR